MTMFGLRITGFVLLLHDTVGVACHGHWPQFNQSGQLSHSRDGCQTNYRRYDSFTTGAVWSAILATAGLLIVSLGLRTVKSPSVDFRTADRAEISTTGVSWSPMSFVTWPRLLRRFIKVLVASIIIYIHLYSPESSTNEKIDVYRESIYNDLNSKSSEQIRKSKLNIGYLRQFTNLFAHLKSVRVDGQSEMSYTRVDRVADV